MKRGAQSTVERDAVVVGLGHGPSGSRTSAKGRVEAAVREHALQLDGLWSMDHDATRIYGAGRDSSSANTALMVKLSTRYETNPAGGSFEPTTWGQASTADPGGLWSGELTSDPACKSWRGSSNERLEGLTRMGCVM
jgi:hypothetical protein